ncbi:flavodoxin [Clostridium pasteurianum DSM 525 = ATCC 6013]|uniref:Flavodoxin n=1 Tax=Clostridium pasteurianum DSM 525 = ATCC 6013 TaxID=1262449 RepID=A0A0H3J6D0_CLOPA|nr:flavodoxin [Clostridium pasteurianum]AJA47463.1 flavodoxin [Clostridium pasteurianum DSM 525 = ATCC 6013]AJA51451.1 flavodoxin [Clostridium pasteurianum DSM 525 = ATCC 6013]AOZ74787.1 flavodoxin [Clostridium pasteurianum DSM 525 = ATCC 6013]AOZ78583.1 flavodoxin [Clostridium pasteurianum]ELP58798.1 flavodoxin [Clostridium pasteurianum DSM 525 = ATCC 6013]
MSKVNIIYWSGTGNTEAMAKLIAEGAQEKGAEVKLLNVSDAKEDDVKEADVVAFGSPSMGSEVVEESEMQPFLDSVSSIVTGKKVALFGSYGWGDGEWMRNWVSEMDNLGANVVNDGLIVQEAPEGDSAEDCKNLGRELV